jgi:hypothetical protein
MVRKNKRQNSLSKRRKLVRQDIYSPMIDDDDDDDDDAPPTSSIYIPVRGVTCMQD